MGIVVQKSNGLFANMASCRESDPDLLPLYPQLGRVNHTSTSPYYIEDSIQKQLLRAYVYLCLTILG